MDAHLYQRMVGSIALLKVLNESPHPRRCFAPPALGENDAGRVMSVRDECRLGKDLAFLAATTDDVTRVMAVAVEEHTDGKGMTWRVASNTGVREEVMIGLRGMARILVEGATEVPDEASDGTEMLRERLFEHILGMGKQRILSRLRSKHSRSEKSKGKRLLVVHAAGFIDDALQKRLPKNLARKLRELRSWLAKLGQQIDELERTGVSMLTEQRAIELLGVVIRTVAFPGRLKLLKDTTEEAKRCLGRKDDTKVEELAKLGYHWNAACNLARAARGHLRSLLTSVRVEAVEMTERLSARFNWPDDLYKQTMQKGFQRISSLSETEKKVRFTQVASQMRSESRVHAEIQLLFFYETHPEVRRPRLLCASKMACYLCHSFVNCHGQFEVPGTHGRLYPRWTLPAMQGSIADQKHMRLTCTSFCDELDRQIRAHRGGPRRAHCMPESQLNSPWPSTSTLRPSNEAMEPLTPPKTPSALDLEDAEESSSEESEAAFDVDEPEETANQPCEDVTVSPPPSKLLRIRQAPTSWHCYKVSTGPFGLDMCVGRMRALVWWDPHGPDADPIQSCWLGLIGLTLCSTLCPHLMGHKVFDLDVLDNSKDVLTTDGSAVENNNPLFLRVRDRVLVIKFEFGAEPTAPILGINCLTDNSIH